MEETADRKEFFNYLQNFKEEEMDADFEVDVETCMGQPSLEFPSTDIEMNNMEMVDDGIHSAEAREERLYSDLISCLEGMNTVKEETVEEESHFDNVDYSVAARETGKECSSSAVCSIETKQEQIAAFDDASEIDILSLGEPSIGFTEQSSIGNSGNNDGLDVIGGDSAAEKPSICEKSSEETEKSKCTIDCYISRREFFFESDHPALKNNSDYRKLLYLMLELEAKRAKAIRDLETLREIKNRALADPIGFVAKLQRGEDMGIPKKQKIPEMPTIDWNKYAITSAECGLSKRQLTRHSARSGGNDLLSLLTKPGGSAKSRKAKQDPAKPTRMSQPWTAEEQKKLEELLVKYPPEDIESRRWEKIANELENRTPTQVASRVQKYFIKLLKAGMPIPGRQPNSTYLRKPRRQVLRQQPSTFFPSFVVPVNIDDNDMKLSSLDCTQPTSDEEDTYDVVVSDDDDVSPEQRNTPEYMELMTIKKAMKRKRNHYISSTAQHIGYKCDRCGCDPIIGVRWHCTECPSSVSTDFCGDCVESTHETEHHSAMHKLEAVRHASSVTGFDSDYSFFVDGEYNYLDPNYMPAS